MQFKYPEILFALFLLLIPIFIHLFQLRRFQKVEFTNVAFLRKVTVQTRKSSQIKKWLTLLMRLLALACIIIAFAQPFFPSKATSGAATEMVVYLDNSFSMQAEGKKGNLLERAQQDLFEKLQTGGKFSWFTNNVERRNTTIQDFKSEILTVDYSPNQLTPTQVLLKAEQFFSEDQHLNKQLIFISDFQQRENFPEISKDLQVKAVQLKPVDVSNVSVDSVTVLSNNPGNIEIKILISGQGNTPAEVPVSLYDNQKLVAKTSVDLSNNQKGSVNFNITSKETIEGKIEIQEANVTFDNGLYFSINTPEKIKVLHVYKTLTDFVQRIFDKEHFDLEQQPLNNLNYNVIPEQNLIVLNELAEIPSSLATALKSFSEAGGSIAVIPASNADSHSYNNLLSTLSLGTISEGIQAEKKITKINFSHPLYKDVFEKEVTNFQYPKVNSFYNIKTSATAALSFEDLRPFLIEQNKNYFFTAPISKDNSNFLDSPLVVPSLYNMGLHSLPQPKLYYTIGEQNTFAVPVQLGPDQILTLGQGEEKFIPLQQTKANQVMITTTDQPAAAGNYWIHRENEQLQNVSFNYSRLESKLAYLDANDWEGATVYNSIDDFVEFLSSENSVTSFWKWFVIFALVFLLLEMLILKFYK